MDIHTATEMSYKNGYEQGLKDAVKHGEWVKHPTFNYKVCSICSQGSPCDVDGSEWLTKYCPNCGAKMDL